MRLFVAVVGVLLALSGCGSTTSSAGATAFPAATAEDWVTYGDYLIEVEAMSEVTLPPDENELSEGEGMFRREFTLSARRVWWSRPGVTRKPPTSQQWVSGGWQFKNGNLDQRKPIKAENQLEVGQHYLAIFTHDEYSAAEGLGEWGTFGALPIVDGRLGRVADGGEAGPRPILGTIRGMTPAEVAALLERTRPDPAVVPYLNLDAPERYQRGVADRLPAGTPGPGER